MKKKWSKIWREFNSWCDKLSDPNWYSQKRQLSKLIRREFPKTNIRKLWVCYEHNYKDMCARDPWSSWRRQQDIIKKAVAAQG